MEDIQLESFIPVWSYLEVLDVEKHISDFVFVEWRLICVYLFHRGKLVKSKLYVISNVDGISLGC